MNKEQLEQAVAKYKWYHNIDLGGVVTPGHGFFHIWEFIQHNCYGVDFMGKDVIDIGCRDGMFSLMAEQMGASKVVACDNDLSKGAIELVIPELESDVKMHQESIYDLYPELHGEFDITMMLGILYHLRYPMLGLRRAIDITKQGGLLLIEGGFFRGIPQDLPMLYCPFVDGNPYEPGSPSYFNSLGLKETMKSMGCDFVSEAELDSSAHNRSGNNKVSRGFFVFRRNGDTPAYLKKYWDGVHDGHTKSYDEELAWRGRHT